MRTTITFEDDVAAAVERIRRDRGVGVSAVVNDLIRTALKSRRPSARFTQRTSKLGLRVDVNDVADALEIIEGPDAR